MLDGPLRWQSHRTAYEWEEFNVEVERHRKLSRHYGIPDLLFFLHLCSTSPSFLLLHTSSFTSQAVSEEEIASTMLSATILGLEKARHRDFHAYLT